MRELNIDFLDLYKSVDRLIKDAYSSGEGVSEYIRRMEANNYKGSRYVNSWTNNYNMLKHIRWIRNQLAHEVGYDSDICEASDYEWLKSFHHLLYSAEDPLALLYKNEKEEQQRREREERRKQTALGEEQRENKNTDDNQGQNKKITIWERIKRFFSGL